MEMDDDGAVMHLTEVGSKSDQQGVEKKKRRKQLEGAQKMMEPKVR